MYFISCYSLVINAEEVITKQKKFILHEAVGSLTPFPGLSGISPVMYFVCTVTKFCWSGSYLSPFPAFPQKWAKTRVSPVSRVVLIPSLWAWDLHFVNAGCLPSAACVSEPFGFT